MTKNGYHTVPFQFPINLQYFNDDVPPADPVDPVDPSPQSEPTPEPADPSQPQEEFDVIKYNKEEVKIPVSERQAYLQKGYNYDKVKTELDSAKQQAQYLERMAKMSGYQTTEDFIRAVEQAEEQARIQQEAQRLGLDENAYKEHIAPVHSELTSLQREVQALRQQEFNRQMDAEVSRLRSAHPDFDQYFDKVLELAKTKGYDLEDAYRLASYEDKFTGIKKETEQETIKKLQQNAVSTPGSLSQDNPDEKYGFSSMSKADQRAFIERVKRGEIQ